MIQLYHNSKVHSSRLSIKVSYTRACHVYEKLGGKNDYKDEIVYVYDYEKGDK